MKRLLIKKRLLKIGLLSVFILVVFPSVCLGVYGGLNYYQVKSLVAEANSLVKVEKFDQAIEKYALAEAKWSPESLKKETSRNLEQTQKLKEEKDNYDNGTKYFDNEKWDSAKEAFGKISDTSKYYKEAQEKLKNISKKIETKEKVATEKTGVQVIDPGVVGIISSPAPQPISSPKEENLSQICENEMNIYKNTLTSKITQASFKSTQYQEMASNPSFKAAVDAEIKRQVEINGYEFYNDCLAGKKRLKDMTY